MTAPEPPAKQGLTGKPETNEVRETSALDPRIHAFDPVARIAEGALEGQLSGEGWRFIAPRPVQVGNARISLRKSPSWQATQVTEALPGEALELLWENAEQWALVRTKHDGYLGWTLTYGFTPNLTQDALTVTALRAHAYAGPKVSQPILAELCLGAKIARRQGKVIVEEHRRWVPVHLPDWSEAWVQEVTLAPLRDVQGRLHNGPSEPGETGDRDTDTAETVEAVEAVDAVYRAAVASLALRFLDTPYVWGGRTAWGLDCSGLTQTVYGAYGMALPRDTDLQEAALKSVDVPTSGDLAFFPGHVGLMLDEKRLVHANATHMRVTVDTLGEGEYGERLQSSLTGFRRWTERAEERE